MNQPSSHRGLGGLIICLICLTYGGCTGEAQPAETADKSTAKTPSTSAPGATATTKNEAALPFSVRIDPAGAATGQSSAAVIKATPATGFKMNVEFPSSFVPDTHAATTFEKPKLAVSDAQVTEEAVAFSPKYTVTKAGKTELSGKISISVCNEKICKLYRNHPVSWSVEAK